MSHHLRRLSTVALTAPLLAGAVLPAVSAHATTVPAHLVSRAQAAAALPHASAMPGKTPLLGTETDNSNLRQDVCFTGPGPVTFANAHAIVNYYGHNNEPTFMVAAIVFHTVADAKVGLAAVGRAETHCPSHYSGPDGTDVRTLTARYGANSWIGWRSTDHWDAPADPVNHFPAESLRINTEFLVRGNVLLELGQISTVGGSVAEQARKQATTAMLAGFAKL